MSSFQSTVGDRESRNISLLDDITVAWRKRTTVLAGHVDSADVWALDTMRCHGHKRCSFTVKKHATRWLRVSSSMLTYTQKQNLSDEIGKQTRESAFGTHPHRPNAENMLLFGHATGEMTHISMV